MKNTLIKFLSAIVVFSILITSTVSCFAVTYPEGVTPEQSRTAIKQTDTLIKNAMNTLQNDTLYNVVHDALYSDSTLSALLTGIYASMTEYKTVISAMGIDTSPNSVSLFLSNYPTVQSALQSADTWENVKLDNAQWNIKNEKQFSNAVASILAPFNDIIYTLLCSGTTKISIIKINGSNGYETGVVPILQSLNCTDILTQSSFTSQANRNKNAMVYNIMMSLFTLIDRICANPMTELTSTLPKFALFNENGGLESAINSLMSPISLKLGNLQNLFSSTKLLSALMFLTSPGKYTLDFTKNLSVTINESLAKSGIQIPEIDFKTLAECNNKPEEAYIVLLNWLADAFKLNTDFIVKEMNVGDLSSTLNSIKSKDSTVITSLVINLFTQTKGTPLNYTWETKDYAPSTVNYTVNLTKEKYQRMVDGIDGVLNEFMQSTDPDATIQSTVREMIYSNSTLTTIVKSLYSALSDDKIKPLLKVIDIPTSPVELSRYISGTGRWSLSNYSSFKNIESVNWGFSDGNRTGFENRLTEILEPFIPVFDSILANGNITLFDSIHICGSNGYETAIIPVLEALGCNEKHILSYSQYEKNIGTDKMITSITDPLFSLIDEIAEKPVYTVLGILPNILFFIDSGSLLQCIENIMFPINNIGSKIGIDINSFGLNLEEYKNKDIITEISKKIPTLIKDIKFSVPNIKSLVTLGISTEKQSKRQIGKFQYIQADKTAILITVLRYIVTAIKDPANSGLLDSYMNSFGGDNEMMAMSMPGILDELKEKSVDEIIEWLYKLLFRERAIKETATDDYVPNIIYQETKKVNVTGIVITGAVIIALVTVCIVKRKEIIELYNTARTRISERKQRGKE